MFGKSTKKLETIIGADSVIKGELSIRGTVRIDGTIEGDLAADWVIVGETGRIRGNTRTRGMVVGGRVDGNIDAAEIVELKDKGQVYGEISTGKLSMSEGALFEGHSSMRKKKEAADGHEGKVKSFTASRTAS